MGKWFRYFTRILELFGGVGLLEPRGASPAAISLGGIMIGAVRTHLLVVGGSAMLAIPPIRSLMSRS
jgi:hypothetical protein